MTPSLLTLLMLAQPEACVDKRTMNKIASEALRAAERHRLPYDLLAAIVLAETGGRTLVAYKRGKNGQGADVGVAQIHCPKAKRKCVNRYRQVRSSFIRAAYILKLGKALCKNPPPGYVRMCRRAWWARYNPGSVKWYRRVVDIRRRLKTAARGLMAVSVSPRELQSGLLLQ